MAIDAETAKDKGTEGKFFTLFIDDMEYRVQQESLTGAQIMGLANIPLEVGLVLIEEDGTQRSFGADEVFTFEGPGRRFKKAPRFKRG
jgi:hypothetical protein